MNAKFYSLPEEKQQKIINAGFRVFSQNTYKKSPVGEIAAEAGISKSLLFHYFKNKKELYLFLWDKCAEITRESLLRDGCYEPDDIFDAMYLSMKSRMDIMRRFPDLGNFAIKAYYEKDPEVRDDIAQYISAASEYKTKDMKKWFDPERFIPGLDLKMMYRDMYLSTEGFIWEKLQHDDINVDVIENEFNRLLDFWRSVYLRRNDL